MFGTNQAFTLAAGEQIVLSTYSPINQNQIFACNRVVRTGKLGIVSNWRRLLRNQFEDIRAGPQQTLRFGSRSPSSL